MSILIDRHVRVICQGITGASGSFHARQMIDYGTRLVAGVTPGKGGQWIEGVPVFETVISAVEKTGAEASVIFVPAAFAADAILEAAEAGIRLAVCITEGIPVRDMVQVRAQLKDRNGFILIGPNCPGLITPDQSKIGIMPGYIHKPGPVGVVSRSGTLTYEAVWQLTRLGIGQSTCVGIGGDPVHGAGFIEILELFNRDEETKAIVMIGEIGGPDESDAARYIQNYMPKPVVAFIAGKTAPHGIRMGHAGAIVSGSGETADAKIESLRKAGVRISDSPAGIGRLVRDLL